jgi:metal-responsive CopG/Arc/MetJ family transcriptional regulator
MGTTKDFWSSLINLEADKMKRFTVSIPKELKDKLDKIKDVNWSEVAKEGVIEKAAKLLKFEELERKGEL